MIVENNNFVAVTYNLIVGENEGKATIMENAPADRPFVFTCGLGMVLPKFEDNLRGKSQGDKFDFTLTPEEAYGSYEDGRMVDLDINIFKDDKGVIDPKVVAVDHTLPMMDAEGNQMYGTIVSIGTDKVKMDFNHPLAGEHLHFVGEVIEVREATAEEMAAATNPYGSGCGGHCDHCNKDCASKEGADDNGGCCGSGEGCCGGGCDK